MSKRLTDTTKWQDDWFLSLPNDYRIIWIYLLDNCTIAGRWKNNLRLLNFCCNVNIKKNEFEDVFKNRIVYIEKGDFYFIPKYLKHQYSTGLTSNKPMILSVLKEIEEYNLFGIITESLGNDYPIIKRKVIVIVKETNNLELEENKKEKDKSGKEQSTEIIKITEPPTVEKVFDYWRSVMNHPNAKLDKKRKRKIEAALTLGYSESDLFAAIDGCKNSPHHQGHNDTGTIYDDLELILRDAGKIDGFIAKTKTTAIGKLSKTGKNNIVAAAEWLKGKKQ